MIFQHLCNESDVYMTAPNAVDGFSFSILHVNSDVPYEGYALLQSSNKALLYDH